MKEQELLEIVERRTGSGKKKKKPLGITYILGGLLFMWLVATQLGNARPTWVWQDFQKIEGRYLGIYWSHGLMCISVLTDRGIKNIFIDDKVTFRNSIGVGSRVSVTYINTDPRYPKLVRGEDIQNIYKPDEEGATEYW